MLLGKLKYICWASSVTLLFLQQAILCPFDKNQGPDLSNVQEAHSRFWDMLPRLVHSSRLCGSSCAEPLSFS